MNERPIDYEKQERIARILDRVTAAGLNAMRSGPKQQPKGDNGNQTK